MRGALENSSSFLDRIERVGIVDKHATQTFELVGPFARAAGVPADMRAIQPYEPYAHLHFDIPTEEEGDGYARLRVLFAEMRQSLRIMSTLCDDLPVGTIKVEPTMRAGHALGWAEAPRGASVQWVELDEQGAIRRYRMTPPSFRNWHGFHVATEGFAFPRLSDRPCYARSFRRGERSMSWFLRGLRAGILTENLTDSKELPSALVAGSAGGHDVLDS